MHFHIKNPYFEKHFSPENVSLMTDSSSYGGRLVNFQIQSFPFMDLLQMHVGKQFVQGLPEGICPPKMVQSLYHPKENWYTGGTFILESSGAFVSTHSLENMWICFQIHMNILPFYSCGALFILSELPFLKTISKRDFTKIIPGDGCIDDQQNTATWKIPS